MTALKFWSLLSTSEYDLHSKSELIFNLTSVSANRLAKEEELMEFKKKAEEMEKENLDLATQLAKKEADLDVKTQEKEDIEANLERTKEKLETEVARHNELKQRLSESDAKFLDTNTKTNSMNTNGPASMNGLKSIAAIPPPPAPPVAPPPPPGPPPPPSLIKTQNTKPSINKKWVFLEFWYVVWSFDRGIKYDRL